MLSVADEPDNRDTLVDHTRTLLRRIDKHGADAPLGIVHRLDRDTSGLMMFTRTATAKRVLTEAFTAHDIERIYHAIAYGDVPEARMETYFLLDRGDGLRGSHGHYRRAKGDPPPDRGSRSRLSGRSQPYQGRRWSSAASKPADSTRSGSTSPS